MDVNNADKFWAKNLQMWVMKLRLTVIYRLLTPFTADNQYIYILY